MSQQRFPARPVIRGPKGFTLMELLVVLVISSAVAGAVIASVLAGFRLWGRIQLQGAADMETMFSLETIGRQLRQGAVLPQKGYAGEVDKFSFVTVDGGSVTARQYRYDAMGRQLLSGKEQFPEIREKKDFEASEPFLGSVENISIAYLKKNVEGKAAWVNAWEEKDGVPAAVRIDGSRKGQTFSKTVFIPEALQE
jgi:prepilin-type N-terminal cleavage/methylation domain-containing protein